MPKFVGPTVRRTDFLVSAVTAAAAAPVASGPWPRKEEDCDAKLSGFDVDAPWHADESQDGNAGCAPGHALTIEETRNAAHAFANALMADTGTDLRKRYNRLIRTYKKVRAASVAQGHGPFGGAYGYKYLVILNSFAPQGKTLELDDIANIHLATVLLLRRAVLALTAHDIDPDAFETERDAEFRSLDRATLERLFSFHFGPNDGSTASYSGQDMVDPFQP
jgi:hypothetical protein